jgi:hypothetical protein
LTCSLSKSSVVLVPGGSNMTVLSCQGSAGDYAVVVKGTAVEQYASGTSHVGNVGYSVVDFTIQTSVNGILVNPGQPGYAHINVTWARGYAGNVVLTTVSSSGLSASISPSSIPGSGIATLTVSSSVAGDYSVVVNATSGASSHTVRVTVTVIAVSPAASIFGLDPATFYSIVGVLAVGVVAGLVAVLRRGKRSKR